MHIWFSFHSVIPIPHLPSPLFFHTVSSRSCSLSFPSNLLSSLTLTPPFLFSFHGTGAELSLELEGLLWFAVVDRSGLNGFAMFLVRYSMALIVVYVAKKILEST